MNLLQLASGLPVLMFLLAVVSFSLLFFAPYVVRNKARYAVAVFRRLPKWAPDWIFCSLLLQAPVSGGLPGTAIGITMNVGYPGTYSRNGDCIIESRQVKSTDTVGPLFGDAVVINQDATGGTFSSVEQAMLLGHTPVMTQGANFCFAGIAVREVLTNTASYLTQNTVAQYQAGQACDVIMRGTVVVQFSNALAHALPTANGPVYLRLVVNGAGTAVGQFEAAADGGNMLLLTNCFWTTGVVDANGAAEITILTRNAS